MCVYLIRLLYFCIHIKLYLDPDIVGILRLLSTLILAMLFGSYYLLLHFIYTYNIRRVDLEKCEGFVVRIPIH